MAYIQESGEQEDGGGYMGKVAWGITGESPHEWCDWCGDTAKVHIGKPIQDDPEGEAWIEICEACAKALSEALREVL